MLQTQFQACIRNKAAPNNVHALWLKSMCYYLDICQKCRLPDTQKESLATFLEKLRENKQPKAQQEQTSDAIPPCYELIQARERHNSVRSSEECGCSRLGIPPAAQIAPRSQHQRLGHSQTIEQAEVLLVHGQEVRGSGIHGCREDGYADH